MNVGSSATPDAQLIGFKEELNKERKGKQHLLFDWRLDIVV